MRNVIPQTHAGLTTAGQRLAAGVTKFGAEIGLLHNTPDAILALVTDLFLGVKNFNEGKAELRFRRRTLAKAARACRAFIMMFRNRMKLEFGNTYTEAWRPTGFRGSLRVWSRAVDLLVGMQYAHAYLLAHPQHELPPIKLTAAEAELLHATLLRAVEAVDQQKAAVTGFKSARNSAARKITNKIRSTISELKHLIGPLDERWKAFGLNMPGAKQTPEAPQNVTVASISNNTVAVKWDAAPRAEYYRVWKRVAGADAEMVAVGRPADLDFTLEDLPPNAEIEIAVSAVNNGGESPLNDFGKVMLLEAEPADEGEEKPQMDSDRHG